MEYRNLGETGMRVSAVSLRTWAFGSEWGAVSADRGFASDDHRTFNREGRAFGRGEKIFSGVDLESGLAAEELKGLVPERYTLAQLALRWILIHPAVSCAIPGAERPDQVEDNLAAIGMPPLSEEIMERIRDFYDRHVRREVYHVW